MQYIELIEREKPVEMPQLRMQTLSRGAKGLSFERQPE